VTEPLITAREAATILSVAPGTVLDWWEAGRLPGFRLGGHKGGPVRFRPSELEAWLEQCRRGPLAHEDARAHGEVAADRQGV
jgi:excisionase family DNA binding protein